LYRAPPRTAAGLASPTSTQLTGLSGLDELAADGGDRSAVHSVAFFFVNRVDTDVDARLEATGT
jgi:hypothetical protein